MRIDVISLRARIRRLPSACEGATAIEYAIIAAGISIAIVAVVGTIGTKVNLMFTSASGIFG